METVKMYSPEKCFKVAKEAGFDIDHYRNETVEIEPHRHVLNTGKAVKCLRRMLDNGANDDEVTRMCCYLSVLRKALSRVPDGKIIKLDYQQCFEDLRIQELFDKYPHIKA